MTTSTATQPTTAQQVGAVVGQVPGCPPHVLAAIYGAKPTAEEKKKAYEASLQRWWTEYADRKNDEEDEHVSDSLLYDRSHLPRTIPAPDCVVLKPVPTRAPAPPRAVLAPVVVAAPTQTLQDTLPRPQQ